MRRRHRRPRDGVCRPIIRIPSADDINAGSKDVDQGAEIREGGSCVRIVGGADGADGGGGGG